MPIPPSWEIYDCVETGDATSVQSFIVGLPWEAKVEALAFLKLLEEFGGTLTNRRVSHGADGSLELRGLYVRILYKIYPGRRIGLLGGMLSGADDQDRTGVQGKE